MILGTLSYNEESEEGEIEIAWENMPDGVMCLDTLGDWIAELTKAYNREMHHAFMNTSTRDDK